MKVFKDMLFSRKSVQICPVVNAGKDIMLNSSVMIVDEDDDMNGVCGIFKGFFKNIDDEYRSLIILEGNKCFYAKPETVFQKDV